MICERVQIAQRLSSIGILISRIMRFCVQLSISKNHSADSAFVTVPNECNERVVDIIEFYIIAVYN